MQSAALHRPGLSPYASAGQVIVILRVLASSAKEHACPLIVAVPVQPAKGTPLTTQSKFIPVGVGVSETKIVASTVTPFASAFIETGSGRFSLFMQFRPFAS